jgi:nucleoside-diphosphate-sugar epimerase
MKAIVIGSGTIGSAVRKALAEKGHEVVFVGPKSGDYQADISDPESLKTLFSRIGSFDAVANAAGDVSFGALEESTDEQWANSIKFKGMGQIRTARIRFRARVSSAVTDGAGPGLTSRPTQLLIV